ncbi:carbohydrate ABC transporter permease [Cohnella lupini]|uniref:Raffinose/stachyose/melibiose transport system permease protein n=1 Tax=Cohnella lupini TaxID=1294267 RepID=A0A3D9HNW6_9BACL|nr:sugar ABC transporter permease [Cohnella lupini]RED51190.1 raffinose/stachyose/melibiose transport system permease protein [Cohnella lupini]
MEKNNLSRSTTMNGLPWILPAFVFVAGLIYYSIFYTFKLSTLDWNGLDPIQITVGMSNYDKAFSDWIFWKAIKNTAVFFLVTFFIQNLLGFIFAAILHSNVKLATLHKCLIFIPTILAPATMAPVFRLLFSPQGMLQDLSDTLHLGITVDWLAQPDSALYILMMVTIWQFTGMSFILYYAAMSQIDKEMLEASHLDGAGKFRTLLSIVLPNCKSTTVSLAMLGIIGSLKTFDVPYLITTGGPNHATEFLGTYIFKQGIRQSHLGYAAAISVLLLVLAICGAILINRMNKGGDK